MTFLFVAVALLTAAAREADAGLIALWNFNDGGPSGTSNTANTAALFAVDRGLGTMSSNFDPTTIVDFNGTTTNAQGSDPAGVALALQNGTNAVNNGAYLQFTESTAGNTNIVVSFAIQATPTGFNSDQLQYTTDGVSFVNFGGSFTPISSTPGFGTPPAGLQTFDLSSIVGLNNNANAGFRIVFNGGLATSSSGNNRIDNVLVSGTATTAAVPEPSSLVLVGLGLAGLVAVARRGGMTSLPR